MGMQTNQTIAAVRQPRAFSLLELLMVVSIIAVLVSLLMPSLAKAKQRAQRIFCVNNLKQIGAAYQVFSADHGGKFPMQILMASGGTMELVALRRGPFADSHRQLQVLSNEIQNPKVLICPTDRRVSITNFPRLTSTNISYLVNSQTIPGDSGSVLSLDRNFILAQTNLNTLAGVQRMGTLIRWTAEMHNRMGNILYADIHADFTKDHAAFKTTPSASGGPANAPFGSGMARQGDSQAAAPRDDGKGRPSRQPASGPSGRAVASSGGDSKGGTAISETSAQSTPLKPEPAIQTEGELSATPSEDDDARPRWIAFIAMGGYLISLMMALIVLLIAYLRARKKPAPMASQPSVGG